MVAGVARRISAARCVTQPRWPCDWRWKRTATASEQRNQDNDARAPHGLRSIILMPPHHGPTRAADHPHPVALQPPGQFATSTVLLEEGVKVGEDCPEVVDLVL